MEVSLKPYSKTLLRILGIFLLLIGLMGLFYGPLEIYCFYLFSSGGKFYYEGFQIGSFWFAYLVIQNAAYYIVAFLMIPIGIGTYKLQEWGRKLSLNLLYVWIIFGISIISSFIVSVPEFLKNINLFTIMLFLIFMALFGIIIPFIFIKIYNNNKMRVLFKNRSKNFIENVPQAILLICSLNILFIILLHASALFQYIFPVFGEIILLREAAPYISASVFILAILTYGFWNRHFWAFWGLITYYLLVLISTVMTFSKYPLSSLINLLNLPSYEQTQMIPVLSVLLNFDLTVLLGSFLIIILGLAVYSRKYFPKLI